MDVDRQDFQSVGEALEAIETFDPAETKRALRYLVDVREVRAIPHVLPLTQHPSAALRFVAKRALQDLRQIPKESARPSHLPLRDPKPESLGPSPEPEILPMAVGSSLSTPPGMDPRLEALLKAKSRRRERRPRLGGVPMRWFDMEL